MRKILVSESLTLDGVFEGPDKSKNDTFEHAGWSEPYVDEEQMKLAEGFEIPNHLSDLLKQTQRTMELSGI